MSYDVKRKAIDRTKNLGVKIDYGPHLALVVNNNDSLYSGRLQVWIPNFGGDSLEPSSWHTVSYASPFYGISSYSATQKVTGKITAGGFRRSEDNPFTAGYQTAQLYQDTPQLQGDVRSFGMWTQPPAIGTRVLVVFADGDTNKGFWIAVAPEVAHGMIPAIGKGASGQPEAEFDPASIEVQTATDIRTVRRPPLADVAATYTTQGLTNDPQRGYVSSSSFRESPSKVMGFSTPSGHSFVMDDGSEAGDSKLVRIRTAGGNQITLNDDTGMMYFINAKGTAWMELGASGQVDVYGEAGISFATKGDINMHAGGKINMHANDCVKIVADNGTKIQGTRELQLHSSKTFVEGVDSIEMHSCGEIKITSFKDVFIKSFNFLVAQAKCFRWNSGTAKEAEQVPPEKTATVSGYDTTVTRAPSHEPYDQHDQGGAAPGSAAAAAIAAGATPQQAAAIQAAAGTGGAGTQQAGAGNIPEGVSFVDPTQPAAPTINVATREEAMALAKTAPVGTVINYGQQVVSASNPNTALTSGPNNGVAGAVIGGLVGSRFGQGSGNIASTLAGGVVGRLIAGGGTFTEVDAAGIGGILGGLAGSKLGNKNPLLTIAGTIVGQSLAKSLFTGGNTQTTIAQSAARYVPLPTPRSATVPATSVASASSRPSTSMGTASGNMTSSGPKTSEPVVGNQYGGSNASANFGNNLANTPNNVSASANFGNNQANLPDNASASANFGNNLVNTDGTKANPAIASQQLAGAEPATSIPAAPGGGNTGCFATGDNCGRPSGQGAAGKGSGESGTQGPYAPGGKADPVKEQDMYDYLTKEKGLNHEQATGIIANIQGESAYKSDAVGDNGDSIGLFQYNKPAGRAGPFEAAVPDWRTNWKGQIDYALTQDPVGKRYASTKFTSSGQASDFWVQKFEIPADIPGQQRVRGSYAARLDSTLKRS